MAESPCNICYIGIHITCTTDTAQTLTHPTLMNNIFTSTLGIKCALPVSYARQQPRAAPAEPHLTHHFTNSRHHARCSFNLLLHPNTLLLLLVFGLLFGFPGHCFGFDSLWLLAKKRSYTLDDRLQLLLPLLSSSSASSPALYSADHRYYSKCFRRMSSYTHVKHTLYLHCWNVLCSVEIRSRACGS